MVAELEAMLARDLSVAHRAERWEFDRISRGRDLVLMGAGGLGRRTLAGLRAHGVLPLAFADNAPARHGTRIDGVPVLSPAEAARQFGSRAAFVVTIWGANSPHRYAHSRDQLHALGCDVVCPFPPLLWRYADDLLPFYLQDLPSKLLEQRGDVLRAFDLWEDEPSRHEYVAQVRLRLDADFDGLPHPVGHPQYFPDDLFAWAGVDEWIVDGGAYDGDTVRTIAAKYGDGFGRVLALEPDPVNFARLQATVASLPVAARQKVDCRQVALAAAGGTLHLAPTGTVATTTTGAAGSGTVPAGAAGHGTVPVAAAPLDALVDGAHPTMIKLDIEGAEIEALEGARRTIARDAPILAVCVYHLQHHLWAIPLLLRSWREDYALFLRPHNEEGWDLVCYAVPRTRLRTGTA